MKVVLITGGFGLLGNSLVDFLLKKSLKVIVLDHSPNKRKKLNRKHKYLKVIKGNFTQKKSLNRIFKKYRFSCVFHLGAQTQVLDSLRRPYETYETNVIGTLNLIEKIRESKFKIPFIYSSSDFIYSNSQKQQGKEIRKFFHENDKFSPGLPYDTSKSSSDLICQSYSKTFDLKVGIVRSSNIYGPFDRNLNRIIPGTIISVIKNKKLIIRSSGKLKRDYLFVDDVCKAYFLIYKSLSNKKSRKKLLIYNLSSKNNFTTLEIVKLIYKILKKKPNYRILNFSKKETQTNRLSFEKIKKELKWSPETKIEDGLKKTINWYIKNY